MMCGYDPINAAQDWLDYQYERQEQEEYAIKLGYDSYADYLDALQDEEENNECDRRKGN